MTGYYIGENTEPTDSDADWDTITLTARKYADKTRMSTELVEDSVIDMAMFPADEFGQRFAEAEDQALFNGDGTSTYGGIVGIRSKLVDGSHDAGALDATSGDDTIPEIVAGDLDSLMGLLPAYALPGAKWYCSQAFNQVVFQAIARAAGGATMIEHGGTVVRSYQGYPIVISQVMPGDVTENLNNQVMVLFGDMSRTAAMGIRRDVTIKVLDQLYAHLDQIAVMGTERFDIVAHELGTNTEVGAMVGLVGNT